MQNAEGGDYGCEAGKVGDLSSTSALAGLRKIVVWKKGRMVKGEHTAPAMIKAIDQ